MRLAQLVRSHLTSSRGGVAAWRQASAGFSSGVQNDASGGTDPAESGTWFQKIKGMFKGKQQQQEQRQEGQQQQHAPSQEPESEIVENLSMIEFADQMKKARQFGSLTAFGRGLPRGGEKQVAASLERQEQILRALARYGAERLGAQQKAEVAAECSCTAKDVDAVLGKYEWMKEVHRRCAKLKEEGKPLPKSMQEVEEMMKGWWSPSASVNLGKTSDLSRNAQCPCNSGKKYKRCCGRDSTSSL